MKEKKGPSFIHSLDKAAEAIFASPDTNALQTQLSGLFRGLTDLKSFALYFITPQSQAPELFFTKKFKQKQLNELTIHIAALYASGELQKHFTVEENSKRSSPNKRGNPDKADEVIKYTLYHNVISPGYGSILVLGNGKDEQPRKSDAALIPLITRIAGQRFSQLHEAKQSPVTTDALIPETQKDGADSKNRFSFVLNTVADGILVFNSENLILMANREAEKIWGYEPDTLTGQYIHKLLEETENAPPALINFLLNPTADSEIIGKIIEFIGFRKDKTRFPLEAKIQESIIDGELFFTAAVADITERKEFLEALVTAKEKAEESTRAKEEFLAHISHEIRTPINAVIGLTSLLLHLQPSGEALEYLKGIKVSSDNLLLLVNDVLDLSKIQAGKIVLIEYEFELSDIFNRIYQILAVKAAEKNLTLSYDIDPAVPSLLYGDAARLSQVLLNLASNAVKFTNHGSIFYSANVKKSDETTCEIEFRVKDTGIGIPKDKLQDIFESFTQITYARRTHASGTGLGLTISKLLVEQFGGKLIVKSTFGAGSVFSFTITLKRIPENEKPAKIFGNEEDISADLDQVKILIVEDNKLNVLVIRKMLELWNASYEVAGNGAEAIEFLNRENFDLILMDISMPILNGYETTSYIRHNFAAPKRDIPILALTATILIDDKKSMTDAGMNDYIAKPFQAGELISKIISYTNRGTIKNKSDEDARVQSSSPEKSFDLSYLKKAFNDDKDSLKEFIEKFLEQVPESFENLNSFLETDDLASACKAAHKIKSPFTYLGIRDSVDILSKLESGLEKGLTKQEMQRLAQTLNDRWEIIKNELEHEIIITQ